MRRLLCCAVFAVTFHGAAPAFLVRLENKVPDSAAAAWTSPGPEIHSLWYESGGELVIVAGKDVTRWSTTKNAPAVAAGRLADDFTHIVPDAKAFGVVSKQSFDRWATADGKLTKRGGIANPGGHPRVTAGGSRLVFWTPGEKAALLADREAKPVPVKLDEIKTAGLVLSPTGRMIAVSSPSGSVQIANLKPDGTLDKKVSKRFPHKNDIPLGFSPDGRLLAVASGGRLVLLDVNTAQIYRAFERRFDDGDISAFAFSPDGATVAFGTREPSPVVRAWHVATGKLLGEFTAHRREIKGLAFDPAGRQLAAGDAAGRVIVWKLADDAEARKAMPFADAWQQLDSINPLAGHQALTDLLANETSRTLLDAITNLDKERDGLRKTILNLDSDEFRVREAARRALAKTGYRGMELLQEKGRPKLGAEGEERVRVLLETFERDGLSKPENDLYGDTLRLLRAMQVLETNLTPEATGVLEELKKRLPGTRVAADAEAILATPRTKAQE